MRRWHRTGPFPLAGAIANLDKVNGITTSDKITVKITPDRGKKFTKAPTVTTDGKSVAGNVTLQPNGEYNCEIKNFTGSSVITVTGEAKGDTSGGSTTPVNNYCTLFFEENGGSEISPLTVRTGTTINLNQYDINRLGYTFDGWYKDKELTQSANSLKLMKNTYVYAKWSLNGALNTEDHFAYAVGYSDGTIKPYANISRAETATILYRLLTAEQRDKVFTLSNSFIDTSIDLWYNKAVSSMAKGGYIQGYVNGTFSGNQNITRAEFVAIVVRFLGITDGKADFNDITQEHWAYNYIGSATSAGWITGYLDGSFKPDQAITRAEAMAVINRVLNRGTDESGVMEGFRLWPDNPIVEWYYYEVIEATNAHEYKGARPYEKWTDLNTDYIYDIVKYEHPQI